ncbi:MAG: hypothetical protein V8T45_00450 [Oscillospiraceae bacterium]
MTNSGIAVAGKKALVLGSGGASVTVVAVLKRLGAASVTVISRTGENNYDNIQKPRRRQNHRQHHPPGHVPQQRPGPQWT